MKQFIYKLLDIEPQQAGRVFLMLGMGFFMGIFLATFDVASATLFLLRYADQLPIAILLSGTTGIVLTVIYNFFQSRIPYKVLAVGIIFLVFGLPLVDVATV